MLFSAKAIHGKNRHTAQGKQVNMATSSYLCHWPESKRLLQTQCTFNRNKEEGNADPNAINHRIFEQWETQQSLKENHIQSAGTSLHGPELALQQYYRRPPSVGKICLTPLQSVRHEICELIIQCLNIPHPQWHHTNCLILELFSKRIDKYLSILLRKYFKQAIN